MAVDRAGRCSACRRRTRRHLAAAKAGKSLRLTVSPFRRLSAATRSAVEEEAQPLAKIRELDETRVVFGDV